MGKLLNSELIVAEQDQKFTENPNIHSPGALSASNAMKPGRSPPAMNDIIERSLIEPEYTVSLKHQLLVFIQKGLTKKVLIDFIDFREEGGERARGEGERETSM